MKKNNFMELKESFLNDDGLDRDVVLFAKAMRIEVCLISNVNVDFVAVTQIYRSHRKIILNNEKIQDYDMLKFILSYQLAELIILNKEELCSIFKIELIDAETYKLAQDIFNRSNKYKSKQLSNNKILKKS